MVGASGYRGFRYPRMRITGSHVLSGFLAPFSRIDQSQSPCARETGNSSGGGQDKAS